FIGYNQRAFAKDLSNYYIPTSFIAQRRKLVGAGRSALVAVNTFSLSGQGAPPRETAVWRAATKDRDLPASNSSPGKKKEQFRVNRFGDLFSNP
ncbi:MAG TPA: hypothetical protein VFS35_06910, partial [Terrimicrobiaceae bacterium]|nr:hypothetical protein [Terrimicrobiaceae bacterium]